MLLYSIGHSTHPLERLLELLDTHRIGLLADIRAFPASRRYPYFNAAELDRSLTEQRIRYRGFRELGGRRQLVRPDSPHTAWQNAAFHAYADYMDTAEFEAGFEKLLVDG